MVWHADISAVPVSLPCLRAVEPSCCVAVNNTFCLPLRWKEGFRNLILSTGNKATASS